MKWKAISLILTISVLVGICSIPQYIVGQIPRVQHISVVKKPLTETIHSVGTVTANQTMEVYISAPIIAADVLVEPGDRVEAGELLCQVDTTATSALLSVGEGIQELYQSTGQQKLPKLDSKKILGVEGVDIEALLEVYHTAQKKEPIHLSYQAAYQTPIDGTITEVNIRKGSLFLSPKPAIVISDLSAQKVIAQVPQRKIDLISVGDTALVHGNGLSGQTFQGEITEISPTAKRVLNGSSLESMVAVEILIEGENDVLKPNYLVNVDIASPVKPYTFTVPFQAIGQDFHNQEYVYVLGKDHRAHRRVIKTGMEGFEETEVLSGLSENEIILYPTSALYEGCRVILEEDHV